MAQFLGLISPTQYTVATLPVSPATGTVATVTDGATSSTGCTAGSGSVKLLCYYNGSSWSVIGASSGSSGTVNTGTSGQVAYYASSTNAVSSDANLGHASSTLVAGDTNGINAAKGTFTAGLSHHIIASYPNDGSTGTAKFKLAKVNASGAAVISTSSDTAVTLYAEGDTETSNGATTCTYGTTGNACLIDLGQATLTADGSGITAGHFVGQGASNGVITDLGAGAPSQACVGYAPSAISAGATGTVLMGNCHIPSGSGTVTTSGSPVSGELAKFSAGTVVTNGNLSGDCTTSNTLAVTCTKSNGTSFARSATVNTYTSVPFSIVTQVNWNSGVDYYIFGMTPGLSIVATVGTPIPFCSVIAGLSVGALSTTPASSSFAFTLHDASANSDLTSTCTISAGTSSCTDLAHTPNWTASNLGSIHAVCTGAGCGIGMPPFTIMVFCQ